MSSSILGICSMAPRGLLDELAATYSRINGTDIAFDAVGGVDAAHRVAAGEPFDVVVLASDAIDKLVAAGKLDAGSKIDLVRSSVGVAVRAGVEQPDISTLQALQKALLAAPSIGYSTGPSGTALMALFERWGIAEPLRHRLVQAPPGVAVGSLVARGDAAIGFQQMSELIGIEGIRLLSPSAHELRITTVFSGASLLGSLKKKAVRAFLQFVVSEDCAEVVRSHGLDPCLGRVGMIPQSVAGISRP